MKKLIALFVVFVMLVSIVAGCTNQAESVTTTTTEESKSEETSTAAPSEEPTEAPPEERIYVEDPDTYEAAVLYSDLISLLGPVPKPAEALTIGFAAKAFENEFWRSVKEGVEAQAQECIDAGIDITVDVRAAQGESDEQGQAALMNDMINKEYAAIIASPISDGNLVPPTENAQTKGIPVINTIGGFAKEMDVYVGPRHYMSGELAAQWIEENVAKGEAIEVAVVMGMAKESAARGRTEGFQDWFAANAPNVTVVDVQNADWDRMKAKDVMDTLMIKHPNLKAVYCNNDTMAMGVVESVKGANKLGEIIVVGNDGTSEALESIKNGDLSATVNIYPDFGGKISLDIALRYLAGQSIPKVVYTSQALIDSTNVNKPAEEIIGWQPLTFE